MIWSELIKLHTFKYTNKICNTKKRKVLALSFLQRIREALHTAGHDSGQECVSSVSDASAVLILLQFRLQLMRAVHEFCVSVCVNVCQPRREM